MRDRGAGLRRLQAAVFAAALIAVLLGVATPQARAVTLIVTTASEAGDGICDTSCTLREAIARANEDAVPDTIALGATVYTLEVAGGDDDNTGGDLDVTSPITIQGAGSGLTTIRQTVAGERVIHVLGTGELALQDLTVTGGQLGFFTAGGGVLAVSGAELTVTRCFFTGNVASGGGIASSGTTTISDSVFSGNGSTNVSAQGGAIINDGLMTISNSSMVDNDAGSEGGAIDTFSGTLTIERSIVSGNTGGVGGGLNATSTAELILRDTTVSDNQGIYGGGGLAHTGTGNLTIERSTFARNSAGPDQDGGGVFILANGITATIDNSTFSGNDAEARGGGIFAAITNSGTLTITHTTIVFNTSDSDSTGGFDAGGGVYWLNGSPGLLVSLEATIIVGNDNDPNATTDSEDCSISQGTSSDGFNVFGTPGGTTDNCVITPLASDSTEIGSDFLGPLGFNGGLTETHPILETAIAQDKQASGAGCPGTDQRGLPRPAGTGCDAGSYELTFCKTTPVNVVGTAGKDVIQGTNGDDGILALGGNDKVFGNGGNDAICGGDGNDKLFGGDGDDYLKGQAGTDKCFGDLGVDTLKCEIKQQD